MEETGDSLKNLICPVCGAPLLPGAAVWRCESGHCFDVARQGYVNLLPVTQKHSLRPGDSREMVLARRRFLDGGYYAPIAEALRELVDGAPDVLDAGCGEGYYLGALQKTVPERWGIDISKEAVRCAAGRDKTAHWLTATAAHLPFVGGSFSCVLSMFALTAAEEFARVLRPDGCFVQVIAGPEHLMALKRIVYPTLTHKEKTLHPALAGFSLETSRTLEFDFTLEGADAVHDLLYMTPHVHRINAAGAAALAATERLHDRAQVIFNRYRRQAP